MCLDILQILMNNLNFQTPHNRKRKIKHCTTPPDEIEDNSHWSKNVKRRLIFEEENAFIKLQNNNKINQKNEYKTCCI